MFGKPIPIIDRIFQIQTVGARVSVVKMTGACCWSMQGCPEAGARSVAAWRR